MRTCGVSDSSNSTSGSLDASSTISGVITGMVYLPRPDPDLFNFSISSKIPVGLSLPSPGSPTRSERAPRLSLISCILSSTSSLVPDPDPVTSSQFSGIMDASLPCVFNIQSSDVPFMFTTIP